MFMNLAMGWLQWLHIYFAGHSLKQHLQHCASIMVWQLTTVGMCLPYHPTVLRTSRCRCCLLLFLQSPAQPQPVKPVSSVQIGTYTGSVKCNNVDFAATFTVTPGNTPGTFELDQNTPFNWFTINCDFEMQSTCRRADQGFCRGGQDAWLCKHHTFVKWTDT